MAKTRAESHIQPASPEHVQNAQRLADLLWAAARDHLEQVDPTTLSSFRTSQLAVALQHLPEYVHFTTEALNRPHSITVVKSDMGRELSSVTVPISLSQTRTLEAKWSRTKALLDTQPSPHLPTTLATSRPQLVIEAIEMFRDTRRTLQDIAVTELEVEEDEAARRLSAEATLERAEILRRILNAILKQPTQVFDLTGLGAYFDTQHRSQVGLTLMGIRAQRTTGDQVETSILPRFRSQTESTPVSLDIPPEELDTLMTSLSAALHPLLDHVVSDLQKQARKKQG